MSPSEQPQMLPAPTLAQRVPPELLVMMSAVSVYLGASVAVTLFEELPAVSVAWLRILGAVPVLLFLFRCRLRAALHEHRFVTLLAFGVGAAGMNVFFYLALETLPMGTTVAIEFVGPIAVALFGNRSARAWLAVALAAAGVACISGAERPGAGQGVAFALCAAALLAVYITMAQRVAGENGPAALALAFCLGGVLVAPFAAEGAVPAFFSTRLLALSVLVGVLSNAIPYSMDQWVLKRVSRTRFAILTSLFPFTATLVAFVTLGQMLRVADVIGIVAIALASLLSRRL